MCFCNMVPLLIIISLFRSNLCWKFNSVANNYLNGNLCRVLGSVGVLQSFCLLCRSNSSVVHRYTRASVFTVSVECTTSEWHVAAQKTISVLEPISEFGTIRCYSKKQWRDSLNCSVLYGSTLQIQVELEAGNSVCTDVWSNIHFKYKICTFIFQLYSISSVHIKQRAWDCISRLQLLPFLFPNKGTLI